MTIANNELARPRGKYGVDGDYRLIPAPALLAGYLAVCLAAVRGAIRRMRSGRLRSGSAVGVAAAALIGAGIGIRRFTLRGKFEIWADLLTSLRLRGDERVLDVGCGRGAVLTAVAKLLPRGTAVGVDIWRADQTGNCLEATLSNAAAEGVADRVEVYTRDMTDLQFDDATFDLIVSSLAIHNLPGNAVRLKAIDEVVRVLRPGGRVAIADIGFTRLYGRRLRELGMTDVRRRSLGWRGWWGVPMIRTIAVTATKPEAG